MPNDYLADDGQARLRIMFLAHRIPFPPDKGDKLRSFWQLRTLAQRHDVDLFCFYDDPDDEKHIGQLRQYCRECYVERLSYLGSRARAFSSLLRGHPFSSGFFYSPAMWQRIRSAFKSQRYDRIFVFSSAMAQYVEGNKGFQKVLDLVDVDSDKWRQYARHSVHPLRWLWNLEARRLATYEASLVRTFYTTVVCTAAEARLLRGFSPAGSIQVLENYIDGDRYDPAMIAVPDEIVRLRPYIVFSGSMDYLPNIDAVQHFCREIFPLVRQRQPGTHVVIAGRNPHRSVRKLGEDPAVKVTGSVPDIRPYLCGASVAVAPLRIARGVQNKVLEALASGVPVVSSTAVANALPESLRQLVRVADAPADFADSVIESLQTKTEETAMQLRRSFNLYIKNLALPSQLEELIQCQSPRFPGQQPSEQMVEYIT